MVVVLYWLVHGKQNIWNGNKICARTNYSLKINLSSELNAYNFTKSTGFFTKNELNYLIFPYFGIEHCNDFIENHFGSQNIALFEFRTFC